MNSKAVNDTMKNDRKNNPFTTDESHWIWSAEGTHQRPLEASPSHYEVRRFRRSFELGAVGAETAVVHVTADSRYLLTCNGVCVARGPGKGDVTHHFYETIDLAPWLVSGTNVLAALVMDYSGMATRPDALGPPTSVMTYAGGFLLEGQADLADGTVVRLSTDGDWKVSIDRAYHFQNDHTTYEGFIGYFEQVDLARVPEGWTGLDFDDSDWAAAICLYAGESLETRRDPKSPYGLMPRMIPLLEEAEATRFADVFRPGGDEAVEGWGDLVSADGEVVVPAGAKWEVILDTGRLTTAYPVLEVAGGAGSEIRLQYAEALRLPWGTPGAELLGERQSLANLASAFSDESTAWTFDRRGTMTGWHDVYQLAGRSETIEPFHWRTFRFVGLTITAADEPVRIRGIGHRFTAYPFKPTGRFESSDPEHTAFWDKSLWTMRLCSHETYEDGPYYEQMQYAGDTRITGMISMLTTGDGRLARQALYQFDWSRLSDGLTHSRYPSRFMQAIPSWSLHWASLAFDYLRITGDRETVRDLLPGIRTVMDWFRRHTGSHGLPEFLPYWNTVDWCPDWQRGQPPGWDEGPTCVISCQYLHGLHELAWLEEEVGDGERVVLLEREADTVARSIHDLFWSEPDGLYHDRPAGPEFSQVGNAWAVVSGVADEERRAVLAGSFPFDPRLARASFFGLHTVFRANQMLGVYETCFQTMLEPWSFMNRFGLDTWAEETSFWRSLCHAWSAHPVLEFIRVILGVEPTGCGFTRVDLKPLTCDLEKASGSVVTPLGSIEVDWRVQDGCFRYQATLPEGVVGRLKLPGMSCAEEVRGRVEREIRL